MRTEAGPPSSDPGWDENVGPFYAHTELALWLGRPAGELAELVARGEILCTPTRDGNLLYPTFQFDAAGALLPGLSDVLRVLDPQRQDPWGDAVWLIFPTTRFDGLSASDMLRDGHRLAVLSAARHDAAKWAQ